MCYNYPQVFRNLTRNIYFIVMKVRITGALTGFCHQVLLKENTSQIYSSHRTRSIGDSQIRASLDNNIVIDDDTNTPVIFTLMVMTYSLYNSPEPSRKKVRVCPGLNTRCSDCWGILSFCREHRRKGTESVWSITWTIASGGKGG